MLSCLHPHTLDGWRSARLGHIDGETGQCHSGRLHMTVPPACCREEQHSRAGAALATRLATAEAGAQASQQEIAALQTADAERCAHYFAYYAIV